MTPRLETVLEKLPDVTSEADVRKLIHLLRNAFEVDDVIYYALSLGGDRANEEFGAMTYSPDWHERYEEANYRFVDPVVAATFGGFVPVDWNSLDWTSRPKKRFLAEASDFGVGSQGYSIPLHGPQGQFAMFTVSKKCSEETWVKLISEISQDLLLAAHHIHRHVLTICDVSHEYYFQALSPREKDVLTMISSGKRRAQIAHNLQISENTLRVYIDSARHKLGALNTFHAIALAVKNGVVKL